MKSSQRIEHDKLFNVIAKKDFALVQQRDGKVHTVAKSELKDGSGPFPVDCGGLFSKVNYAIAEDCHPKDVCCKCSKASKHWEFKS